MPLKIALGMTQSRTHAHSEAFKLGKYKFNDDLSSELFTMCRATIDYIKRMNGYSSYTTSSRFWCALIKLINHSDFKVDKWEFNLARMVGKFGPKATGRDYLQMLMECYNWKNAVKIDLQD